MSHFLAEDEADPSALHRHCGLSEDEPLSVKPALCPDCILCLEVKDYGVCLCLCWRIWGRIKPVALREHNVSFEEDLELISIG